MYDINYYCLELMKRGTEYFERWWSPVDPAPDPDPESIGGNGHEKDGKEIQQVEDEHPGRKDAEESSSQAARSSKEPVRKSGPVELNIWSDQVRWDNDLNFVRFRLPVREGLTLDQVTCSMVHLELGHRLKVMYPGVVFSVLINHSTIKGTIEANISPSELTIRLVKTDAKLWSYATFIMSDSTHLTFHLSAGRHLKIVKSTQLMVLIHNNQLSSSRAPHETYSKLFSGSFDIDPKVRRFEEISKCSFSDQLEYEQIGSCLCDTCTSHPYDAGQSKRQSGNLDIWDVWWQNDWNSLTIYIPTPAEFESHQTKYTLSRCQLGDRLEVTLPSTKFSVLITQKLKSHDTIGYTRDSDGILLHLPKRKNSLWSFLTLATDDSEFWTYHLNPFYHLKVKSEKNLQPNLAHAINLMRGSGLKLDEILEILEDAGSFHCVFDRDVQLPASEVPMKRIP